MTKQETDYFMKQLSILIDKKFPQEVRDMLLQAAQMAATPALVVKKGESVEEIKKTYLCRDCGRTHPLPVEDAADKKSKKTPEENFKAEYLQTPRTKKYPCDWCKVSPFPLYCIRTGEKCSLVRKEGTYNELKGVNE